MEGLGKLGLVFLLSIFLLLSLSQCLNSVEEDANSLKLELIHRHAHPQLNSKPKTQLERVKELHHNDMIRQNMIAHRRRLAQNPPENMGTVRGGNAGLEMQIYSASDYGLGQYFVSFNVGTPPQKFTLVVDTGSELTWMNCRYRCGERCRENARINRRPVFWADLSSSFRPVPCLTRMCKVELSGLFSLNACPTPHTPCGFDFRYVDGSDTLGFFANETVSVDLTDGRTTSLHGVLVGCSDSFKGANFDKGTADGVMGLANGKYSFTTIATQQFGGKFSYCLVDHLSHKNVTNYLVFGSNKRETSLMGRTRHAKLELNLIPPFYAINVVGISVGKKMVNVPVMAWDAMQGGGMILDSGMSLTLLSEPAYRPVMFALEASLTEYERVKLVGVPMEYCFNSTGFEETAVPKLVFHFVHGARFEPFVKSYIIDVAVGVKCLGIVSGTWPASSVIGNIMQQNHLWEFDLVGMKLGFTRSTCT